MNDFVQLYWKRNRGWPWPEDSWGLTPMFGEDGWCHSCGVPNGPQSGSIVLQRKNFKTVNGGWVPNWQFDVICVEQAVGDDAASKFTLELRPVGWHPSSPGDAVQIVVPSVGDSWFDEDELREKAAERHGVAGKKCDDCGVWRWMPLAFGFLPALRISPHLTTTSSSRPAPSGSVTGGARSARSLSAEILPSCWRRRAPRTSRSNRSRDAAPPSRGSELLTATVGRHGGIMAETWPPRPA